MCTLDFHKEAEQAYQRVAPGDAAPLSQTSLPSGYSSDGGDAEHVLLGSPKRH